MKTGGWAAALAAAACVMGIATGPAQAACQLNLAAAYKVSIVSGQPMVEAAINGELVLLIPDLGSQKTFLTLSAAKTLGLSTVHESITWFAPGGSDQIQSARVKDLQLGQAVAHDVDLAVIDRRPLPGKAVGVIGRDFLTAMDLEFDLAHGAIRLFQSKGCDSAAMAYWGGSYAYAPLYIRGPFGRGENYGPLEIDVQLNGKPARASIDTASFSLVDTDTAARVGVGIDQPGVKLVNTAQGFGPEGKPIKIYAATFDSFSFGDETVKNAQLRIGALFAADKRVFTGSNIARDPIEVPEMHLGVDFLYSHRVYIAWGQGRVYASYLGGAPLGARVPSAPAVAADPAGH